MPRTATGHAGVIALQMNVDAGLGAAFDPVGGNTERFTQIKRHEIAGPVRRQAAQVLDNAAHPFRPVTRAFNRGAQVFQIAVDLQLFA